MTQLITSLIKPEETLILVVDDIPDNVQLIGQILAGEKYRIAVATNGKQAISIAEKSKPDLVLLDIMMPDMDGYEVCRFMKSKLDMSNIPIIFLTAKTESTDKIKGFEIGAADYITKPFDAMEVLARVKTHLGLKLAIDRVNEYNLDLERMLQERTKELIQTERHAAFSLMIQGIIHNFKNPITNLMWNSDFLSMQNAKIQSVISSKDIDALEKIDEICKNFEHYNSLIMSTLRQLTTMINSLMAKSRSDKSTVHEIIDLNYILNGELDFMNADLDFKNNIIKDIQLSDKKLLVEIVPSDVSQIFQNLIRNAMDALLLHTDPQIPISTGMKKSNVWFKISDNGPGINQSIIKKIFDPFFTTKSKIGDETDNKPTGTGLGLHSCSEILKSYSGKIEVDSQLGSGTSFTVYLPLKNII
ncbi:MAG: hybrid sensor histidine kinase/response regulator [Candidatus Marinimicrobia bacterium]|nr:hybrid sensor histidine kinase/response regulator [Candidatus Neomarinimicrobiota bacterium]MBT6217055.1 hybrid sensor histidine kinase/response regulator [Candidatus Neomarinimicrobiota bacterium]MBT7884060.1 hybrid sensor histidine kinase/response regulator [Candidatus Neomarinimicrobiota bacterium]